MRILIFILALMSAFFVPATFSFELDLDDLRGPKVRIEKIYQCVYRQDWGGRSYSTVTSQSYAGAMDACLAWAFINLDRAQPCGSTSKSSPGSGVIVLPLNSLLEDGTCLMGAQGGGQVDFDAHNQGETETKSCPPDSSPEHKFDYYTDQGELKCAKLKEYKDCDAGYHSKGTSAALGSDTCLPKECPPAGSGEKLASSPKTGGVPFVGGGMYCNDGCAYSVNSGDIHSKGFAIGTSQGVACGDKPYDNKKLANEGDEGECKTATNGEVTVLNCPNEPPPEPEEPPLNNDDSKVDESDTPEQPKENCAVGDTDCNLQNLEKEIANSINRQIDNDNELHNKKIDADTKNAKAFLNVMDSIDTTLLLQKSQDERLHAKTIGKFNELIDAVNGIQAGGGGGGAGTGSGNGNIGGQDCEGTIEECAGFGGEIELPQETRNLEQYAQKYNNWLPNAELPPEKCITLTNGKSLCFSFEYFIVFFQAISGLIVLSSLIHSASIIVRSV